MKLLNVLLYVCCLNLLACTAGSFTGDEYSPAYSDELSVITRTDWGWTPLPREIEKHHLEKLTIHHGGEFFPEDKDPVEYLRNLQKWSREEKNWIDIPYHYMIDLKGKIYEARPLQYPGDTNTDYDPAGHALICVMGNYEEQVVSAAQLESLAKLCLFLTEYFEIPIETIKGHKDYTETLCPGKDLYKYLQDGSLVNMILEFNKLVNKKATEAQRSPRNK